MSEDTRPRKCVVRLIQDIRIDEYIHENVQELQQLLTNLTGCYGEFDKTSSTPGFKIAPGDPGTRTFEIEVIPRSIYVPGTINKRSTQCVAFSIATESCNSRNSNQQPLKSHFLLGMRSSDFMIV